MAWLGATDQDQSPTFNSEGLGTIGARGLVENRVLENGTFIVETHIPDAFRQPLDLVDFHHTGKKRRAIHVVFGPNGRIWIATEVGQKIAALTLDVSHWEKHAPIRISYSWSLEKGEAVLSAENLKSGRICARSSSQFVALNQADLARINFGLGSFLGDDVTCFAFANHVEPVGYSAGFSGDAMVETEFGDLRLDLLRPGMLISDGHGGLTSVVGVVSSTQPNFGSARMFNLLRPFQNLTCSLSVSARSEIVTRGTDTDYLFGHGNVTLQGIQALPFVPGHELQGRPAAKRWNLILDRADAYCLNGIQVRPFKLCHDEKTHRLTRLSGASFDRLQRAQTSDWDILERYEAIALLSDRYA